MHALVVVHTTFYEILKVDINMTMLISLKFKPKLLD